MNPAAAVRGPKHVVKTGKTPVLDADQARELLNSIDLTDKNGRPSLIGLRDRAIIGVMVFSFARVGAVVGMKVVDYFQDGKRWSFRQHEKGGKLHKVPAHRNAEAYVDEYLEVASIRVDRKAPLFLTPGRDRQLTGRLMHRVDVFRMIRRRVLKAGLPPTTCCHTFRATGITAHLNGGGTVQKAHAIAAHEPPRTTKLYDRTQDEITLDEVETNPDLRAALLAPEKNGSLEAPGRVPSTPPDAWVSIRTSPISAFVSTGRASTAVQRRSLSSNPKPPPESPS